jgi:hypothetical protein
MTSGFKIWVLETAIDFSIILENPSLVTLFIQNDIFKSLYILQAAAYYRFVLILLNMIKYFVKSVHDYPYLILNMIVSYFSNISTSTL